MAPTSRYANVRNTQRTQDTDCIASPFDTVDVFPSSVAAVAEGAEAVMRRSDAPSLVHRWANSGSRR